MNMPAYAIADQAKYMAGLPSKIQKRHHGHNPAIVFREDKNVKALMETIESFTDSFADKSSDLFNLVTKVVIPDSIKEDSYKQTLIGQTVFDTTMKEQKSFVR